MVLLTTSPSSSSLSDEGSVFISPSLSSSFSSFFSLAFYIIFKDLELIKKN